MRVVAVSVSPTHGFHKKNLPSIQLLAGLGVEGDAHAGTTVKHRSRVKKNPGQPNLRQVHLIHQELLDELNRAGFKVEPGELGENVTTSGIALLDLPAGARLRLGSKAMLEITGLRNPCKQIDEFQKGLQKAVLDRDAEGNLVRKAGVMAIVLEGGPVAPGDAIEVELPEQPHRPLEPV